MHTDPELSMATGCGGVGEISCPPDGGMFNYGNPSAASRKTVVNSKVMVVAVAVLFAVVLFILCLHVYAKWFWRNQATIVTSDGVIHTLSWRRRRYRGDPRLHQHHPDATTTTVTTQTVGLERAVVEALPVFEYSGDAMKPGLECAVCLEEFEEGEQGRTLPKCGHHFHLECIDMWLHSHSTCPLCRTSVAPDDETTKQFSDESTVVQIQEQQEATVVGDVGAPFMAAMRASRRRHRSISSPTGLNSLPRASEDHEEADNQTHREDSGTEFPPAADRDATETRLQQSLKDYETPSGSSVAESRQASGIRAPFQVTIDIPRSGAAGFGNNNNSANVMSPMARASASFRRLLSRGKSVVTPQSDEGGPSSSPRPPSPSV